MNVEKRIASSCFVGGSIGTLLALQFVDYLWWLGILLGALMGAVVCQWKPIAAGVKEAYFSLVAWKPDKGHWRYVVPGNAAVLALMFSWPFILLLALLQYSKSPLNPGEIAFLSIFLGAVFTGLAIQDEPGHRSNQATTRFLRLRRDASRRRNLRKYTGALLRYNVVSCLLWQFPKLLICLCMWSAQHWHRLGPTFKKCFVAVHREEFVICAVGSAAGGTIGYFSGGNVILGGVSGAIIGFVEYRLVAVRWLKLQPSPA